MSFPGSGAAAFKAVNAWVSYTQTSVKRVHEFISQGELIAGFLSKFVPNKLDNMQKILPYGYHLIWGASGKNIC